MDVANVVRKDGEPWQPLAGPDDGDYISRARARTLAIAQVQGFVRDPKKPTIAQCEARAGVDLNDGAADTAAGRRAHVYLHLQANERLHGGGGVVGGGRRVVGVMDDDSECRSDAG
jgi:hypothetical protein